MRRRPRRDRRDLAGAVAEFDALAGQRMRHANGCLLIGLSPADLGAKPWLKWNAFVALLSCSSLEELHESQHPAWRAYEYDSEVQHGGHEQYLRVRAGVGLDEAVDALRFVSAPAHAGLLGAAVGQWRRGGITEGQLAAWDLDFAAARPPLGQVLEAYLDAHLDLFITSR